MAQDEANYIAQFPGFLILKDSNYLVSAITEDAAKLCGWKNAEHAIGRIDHDMPSEAADFYITAATHSLSFTANYPLFGETYVKKFTRTNSPFLCNSLHPVVHLKFAQAGAC